MVFWVLFGLVLTWFSVRHCHPTCAGADMGSVASCVILTLPVQVLAMGSAASCVMLTLPVQVLTIGSVAACVMLTLPVQVLTMGSVASCVMLTLPVQVLTMGSVASFVVDVSNSTHFTSITYMVTRPTFMLRAGCNLFPFLHTSKDFKKSNGERPSVDSIRRKIQIWTVLEKDPAGWGVGWVGGVGY